MKYRVLIEQDEDGVFIAQVPSLPGCVTQGATREEALAKAREAIDGYFENRQAHDQPIPSSQAQANPRVCEPALLSEDALARDWETEDEDEAWDHLDSLQSV